MLGCASIGSPFQQYMDCVRDVTSGEITPTRPGIRAIVNQAKVQCDRPDVPEAKKEPFLRMIFIELRDAAELPR
jgi:hypothetical protein